MSSHVTGEKTEATIVNKTDVLCYHFSGGCSEPLCLENSGDFTINDFLLLTLTHTLFFSIV